MKSLKAPASALHHESKAPEQFVDIASIRCGDALSTDAADHPEYGTLLVLLYGW